MTSRPAGGMRAGAAAGSRPWTIPASVVMVSLLATALPSAAQTFPSRPITVIAPFPSGGAVDAGVRAVTERAAQLLGQPIVVEPRPGAGTRIGTDQIVRAPKDGYTLGVMVSASGVNLPALDPALRYHPVRDFTHLTIAFEAFFVIVAQPSLGVKRIGEFLELARAQPGKLNYSSSGTGSSSHIWVEVFQAATGTRFTHVPYKGEGAALQDVIGGQIQFAFASSLAKPHVDSGKLVALAATSPQRLSVFPDVPTAREAGLGDFTAGGWIGFVGPAGLPPAVAERLTGALRDALATPEIRPRLQAGGFVVRGSTPAEFTAQIEREIVRVRDVGVKAGIKLE